MEITGFQAFLIAMVYYLGSATWFGIPGFAAWMRPLVSGFVVGIILGDPVQGTVIGATINMIYIGYLAVGGAIPSDMALSGTLGTALAMSLGLEPDVALTLAVPIGLLGPVINVIKMTANSMVAHWMDKQAEEGNARNVALLNIIPSQAATFVLTFIPVFIVMLYGVQVIEPLIAFLGDNVLNALSVVGGMMPALGIAMSLVGIFKGDKRPYFFLGFVLSVYLGMDILGIAIIGGVAAYLHIIFTSKVESKITNL